MASNKRDRRTIFLDQIPNSEIIEYFNEHYHSFVLRMSNYSCSVTTESEKFLFSTSLVNKLTFAFYGRMKKEIGGEIQKEETQYKYYNFSGIKNVGDGNGFCVDINSAYLSVLRNEQLISDDLYHEIQNRTSNKYSKPIRLKSVGMFASHPVEIKYHDKKPISFKVDKNPFSWVFFLAVKRTFDAMEIVKKEYGRDFLFYWVDGIFVKRNPEKAVKILGDLGFQSKIEDISKIQVEPSCIFYEKDGKEKILFRPNTNSEQKRELKSLIKTSFKL